MDSGLGNNGSVIIEGLITTLQAARGLRSDYRWGKVQRRLSSCVNWALMEFHTSSVVVV